MSPAVEGDRGGGWGTPLTRGRGGGKASPKGGCGFLPLRLGPLGRNALHPSEAVRQPLLAFLVAVQRGANVQVATE